ncbi:MAG: hypothetical protein ABL994_19600, partial [Verrucomicrobiales bacterium]
MNRLLFVSFLPALFCNAVCVGQESTPGSGKTLAKPVKFLTKEAYDSEAKVRISNFKLPSGVSASLFADSSQTQNP